MAVDRHQLEEEFAQLLKQPGAVSFLEKSAFDGLWYWNLERPDEEWVSAGFWTVLGYPRPEKDADWRELIFPEDRNLFFENLRHHCEDARHPFDQTLRFRGAGGETVTMRCRGMAVRRDAKAVRMLGFHTVVHDTKAHDVDRQLSELVELSGDAVFAWSLRGGVKRWNRGAVALFGHSSQVASGRDPNLLTEANYPDDWASIQERLEAGQPWSGEIERRRSDGTRIYTSARLSPVEVSGDDVLILQIERDVTAEHRTHERLRLLNRELNHRVKNLFAIVQGLVSVSSRGERDAAVVTDKIQARIAALAAAHLISIDEEEVRTVSFKRVLEAVLAPYEQRNDQLTIRGVEAKLPRRAVTPIGMIFHELATNAVKYGAWAENAGHLTVTWMADEKPDGSSVLHVRWVERFARHADGAPETPAGLGLPLIQQSARQLDGDLKRTWSEEGMETLLSFSLAETAGAPLVRKAQNAASRLLRERTDVN